MVQCIINGVTINFPFEPYDLQKDYMSKVLDCLQQEQHGVLESPTGTGKTLSLLCSSLAWLELRKAQIQANWQRAFAHCTENSDEQKSSMKHMLDELNSLGSGKQSTSRNGMMGMPQIIYSSRTHSQLSQAMQELKRTSYSHMKASVLGSRDQMCVHPDIKNEESGAMKVNMCQIKVKEKSCHFYNRVERFKDSAAILDQKVVDIEDLVMLGEKHKFCPYYMSKEIKQNADIVFMPYNYLLDPRARKALGVELTNNIIILDEAHNVEKICEDSASLQLKTTDIALCIEEVTEVMKAISDENADLMFKEAPDFSPEDLCLLKEMFLNFEKTLDAIVIPKSDEGVTFEGGHMFKMLADCGITDKNCNAVITLLERICTFLATVNKGPFQRRGVGLQLFEDMLRIAFADTREDFKQKIQKCYKVHVIVEEPQNKKQSNWLTKATSKVSCRVLSYWCFSPGFGMNMMMGLGVKSVILTSGTLAPLKPLITELELKVGVQLENPHIVTSEQVCVKVLSKGPDGNILNCSYQNRNNPAYIKSLGMTISNLARIIPNGLLVFFPSYPLLKKCQEDWQEMGLWAAISDQKIIFVEPRQKTAFSEAMTNYYDSVADPKLKGAIFMGVCRGKVSEGLDFADTNGRAVIIIGLPYPPMKDPKVVLKKRYLDVCRSKNKEYLSGDDWYSLEAVKAVNQAVGRVIRHRLDYGAIILLDSRFNNPRIMNQMSMWLRKHVRHIDNYRDIMKELNSFFRGAEEKFPVSGLKKRDVGHATSALETPASYKKSDYDTNASTSSISSSSSSGDNLVKIHKRETANTAQPEIKRRKILLVPNQPVDKNKNITTEDVKEYLAMVKRTLTTTEYKTFVDSVKEYRSSNDIQILCDTLHKVFDSKPDVRYLVLGLQTYIRNEQRDEFNTYWNNVV